MLYLIHHLFLPTSRSRAPLFWLHFLRLCCNPAKLCHSVSSSDSTSSPTSNLPASYKATSHALISSKSTPAFSASMRTRTISSPLVSLATILQTWLSRVLAEEGLSVPTEEGLSSNAFVIFKELKYRQLLPNDLTFSFLFKACSTRDGVGVDCVKQLHSHVLKSGFMCDSFVCNGLLMVYARVVKDLGSARQVFDEMPDRNLVSCWTSLISGFARLGLAEEALKLFIIMLKEKNLQPDNNTMVSVLSACSSLTTLHIEKWVNLLTGKVEKSREAFNEISYVGRRSVLSWNTMIGAYVQNGCALEALNVFKSMMENYDCSPNHVTMVSVLSACAEVGDLELGMWVHEYMRTRGHKGLAVNGEGEEALRLYAKMQEFHLGPDSGTLLGALCACSHSGLLDKGREIFINMIQKNLVTPRLEHYACYVDLLARSGFIEEALGVVTSMPFEPNKFVWGALLAGCVLHNRLELAQSISTMLVMVDPENSGGYVMLSNSFAADCQWRDVLKQRGLMREKGVTKQPGRSWIKIGGVVHEFVAGSDSYHRIERIHQMMESLLKEMRLSSR
ncbi:hypothetical protein DH2020_006564 [Rehmannia glutinosa]|uniref:Pentatricopeptide repeat-containing protein n=1 Tax=Rehmannia glutinosa TaxID=99300 RepID=A0ABR0XJ83_REHGL